MSEALNFSKDDTDELVSLIVKRAVHTPGLLPQQYLQDLVDRTNWPEVRKLEFSGIWKGNPPYDVRRLVNYALSQPVNPADSRFTTIGSLLDEVLKDVDLTDQRWIVSLIISRYLYRDSKLINELRAKYNVPEWSSGASATIVDVGSRFRMVGKRERNRIPKLVEARTGI